MKLHYSTPQEHLGDFIRLDEKTDIQVAPGAKVKRDGVEIGIVESAEIKDGEIFITVEINANVLTHDVFGPGPLSI